MSKHKNRKKPLAPPPEPLPGVVDAHSHTWDSQFTDDHEEVLARAWATGLAAIVQVGCDLRTTLASRDIAATDARMYAAAGLHPHSASRPDHPSRPYPATGNTRQTDHQQHPGSQAVRLPAAD